RLVFLVAAWPHRSSPTAFPQCSTPPANPLPSDPCHSAPLPPHPAAALRPASSPLSVAVPFPVRQSACIASSDSDLHWPASSCRRWPLAPTSPYPLHGTTVARPQTSPPRSSDSLAETRRSCRGP